MGLGWLTGSRRVSVLEAVVRLLAAGLVAVLVWAGAALVHYWTARWSDVHWGASRPGPVLSQEISLGQAFSPGKTSWARSASGWPPTPGRPAAR